MSCTIPTRRLVGGVRRLAALLAFLLAPLRAPLRAPRRPPLRPPLRASLTAVLTTIPPAISPAILLAILPAILLMAAATALPARAGPILQEVVYDGVGSDADDVFTEILVEEGFSLTGWSLQGVNGSNGKVYRTLSLTGMSGPTDGLLVLATASATGDVLAARDYTANVDWQNGPDAIRLVDPGGTIADALQYGDAGLYNAGEGLWAPDVSAGWSLSRNAFGVDTDDNDADFLRLKAPTPGLLAPTPVPEPMSLGLVAGGLGLLVTTSRRRRRRRAASP